MIGSLRVLPLLLVVLGLVACDEVDSNTRAANAAKNLGDIEIALVWDDGQHGMLVEGAMLAQEEINRSGLLPFKRVKPPTEGLEIGPPHVSILRQEDEIPLEGTRHIRFLRRDAPADAAVPRVAARDLARELATHPNLVAVIGHTEAKTAIPSSVKYEEQGILYINPSITEPVLNDHGFLFTFTTVPDSEKIAKQIATFAFARGYRRLGILNSRTDSHVSMANAFDSHAVTLGMTVIAKRSFFGGRDNYRDLLADFGAQPLDALFLVASPDASAAIVRQSMEMNLNTPFMLTPMDATALRLRVGCKTPHISVPTLFNPVSDRWEIRRFRRAFMERFEREPDPWAAQGYDAVKMLAEAMTRAESTVPLSVATILRFTLSWNGVTGRHSFDRAGSIYTKQIEFATLEAGTITYVSPAGGATPRPETKEEREAVCPSSSS